MNPILQVIAQIVNFVAFVVILYYLLVKPVRKVMKERRDEMEAERRDAEKKLEEAEKLRGEAEAAAKELEDTRESILKEAREQAGARRKELLEQSEALARDRLLDEITAELRDTIVTVAGSVLGDASETLADRALGRIEKLLEDMPDEEVEGARKALDKLDNRVPVRFVGTLTDDQLDRLRKALREKLGIKGIELEVTEDPSLLAGLQVTLGHVQLEAHWRGVIDEAMKKRQEGTPAPAADTAPEKPEGSNEQT